MTGRAIEFHRGNLPQYRRSLRQLRANLWLSNLLWLHELTIADLEYRILPREADGATGTGLAYKWYHGKSIPTARSISRIEEDLANTKWVYGLPLCSLLNPERVRESTLRGFFQETARDRIDCSGDWFEMDSVDNSSLQRRLGQNEYYSMQLRRFMLPLIRARSAEGRSDVDMFLHYFRHALIAFFVVGRIPWIYPHWKQLFRHFDCVRLRCPSMKLFVNLNTAAITELMEEPYIRIINWKIEAGRDSRNLKSQPYPFHIGRGEPESVKLTFSE